MNLYDDYFEHHAGASEELAEFLGKSFSKSLPVVELFDGHPSQDPKPRSSIWSNWSNWGKNLKTRFSTTKPKLPQHQIPRRSNKLLGACSAAPLQSGIIDHNFVLLCVPFMQRALKLEQAEVCKINSDREFFQLLRHYYQSHRGTRLWGRFRKVCGLEFIQVSSKCGSKVLLKYVRHIQLSLAVLTIAISSRCTLVSLWMSSPLLACLPKRKHQGTTTPTTQYQQGSLRPSVQISSHTYSSTLIMPKCFPSSTGESPKLRAKLQACPREGSSVGWGIQYIEGLDLLVTFKIGCLGFAAALLLALVWSVARRDVQGGFAIAGFLLAFLGFSLGMARAEVIIG